MADISLFDDLPILRKVIGTENPIAMGAEYIILDGSMLDCISEVGKIIAFPIFRVT